MGSTNLLLTLVLPTARRNRRYHQLGGVTERVQGETDVWKDHELSGDDGKESTEIGCQ